MAFGKTADVISKYTKKGSQIAIDGSLEQDSWEGQDGKKNYKTKIRISSLQLLGSKDGQSANTDNAHESNEQDDSVF